MKIRFLSLSLGVLCSLVFIIQAQYNPPSCTRYVQKRIQDSYLIYSSCGFLWASRCSRRRYYFRYTREAHTYCCDGMVLVGDICLLEHEPTTPEPATTTEEPTTSNPTTTVAPCEEK